MRTYLSIFLLMVATLAGAQVTTYPGNIVAKRTITSEGPITLNGALFVANDRMQVANGSGSMDLIISSNAFIGFQILAPLYPVDIAKSGDAYIRVSSTSGSGVAGLIFNNIVDANHSWSPVRNDDGSFRLYHSTGVYPGGALSIPLSISTADNFTMAGTLSAGIAEVIGAASATLSEQACRGTTINNFGQAAANTQTLPAAAVGLNGIVHISATGVGAFNLKAAATDKIYLDGVALDDGDKATLSAPVVGDWFTFVAFKTGASAYDWIVTTGSGVLTDGGP